MRLLVARELFRLYGAHNPKLADERWEKLPEAVKESYLRDADYLLTWMHDNAIDP